MSDGLQATRRTLAKQATGASGVSSLRDQMAAKKRRAGVRATGENERDARDQ